MEENSIPPRCCKKHRTHVSVSSVCVAINICCAIPSRQPTVLHADVEEHVFEIFKEEMAGFLRKRVFVDDGSVNVGAIEIATKTASRQNA